MDFIRKHWEHHKTNTQAKDNCQEFREAEQVSIFQNISQDHDNYMVPSMSFSPADISCKAKRLQAQQPLSLPNHLLCMALNIPPSISMEFDKHPHILSVWVYWMGQDKWKVPDPFQLLQCILMQLPTCSKYIQTHIQKKVNNWELPSIPFQRNYKGGKSNGCCLCWKDFLRNSVARITCQYLTRYV